MSMIESVYRQIHYTGIIKGIINTTDKWVDFIINRLYEEHKLEISFYQGDDVISDEYIDMQNDFDPFKYGIYHNQEKDQIYIILVPRTLLMNRQDWKEYV